jgi:hypothetical protein
MRVQILSLLLALFSFSTSAQTTVTAEDIINQFYCTSKACMEKFMGDKKFELSYNDSTIENGEMQPIYSYLSNNTGDKQSQMLYHFGDRLEVFIPMLTYVTVNKAEFDTILSQFAKQGFDFGIKGNDGWGTFYRSSKYSGCILFADLIDDKWFGDRTCYGFSIYYPDPQ